jgi:cytochrome b
VFHWLLVICIFLSWLSQNQDWIQLHLWSGYTVLTLVVFRIGWGFIGSMHSRFRDFLRSPVAVLRYWRGELPERPGHNPAGGWSILVLLCLVLMQASSGLFNSDGLLFDGPLHHALDSGVTDKLGELHDQLFWVILGFIALHVAVILYYQFVRRERLINAMLTGGEAGERAPVSLLRAVALLAFCCAALALAMYFAPEPVLPW